jgi:hypothetical protein
MARLLVGLLGMLLFSSTISAQVRGGVVSTPVGPGGAGIQGPDGRPGRDTRPPATGRSTVRGRVIAADSGQPLRRATVRISAPELRGTRSALTGTDGRYEFASLPTGRYSVTALKSGFVNWSYGQSRAAGPGTPLTLAEGQTADNINISVPRGGVIAGRIVDDLGDPFPNARVTLMRAQFLQGQRRLLPAGNLASTNDIGEYRLFGLAPGQYYVSAVTDQQTFQFQPTGAAIDALGNTTAVEGPEVRNGYAATFYPGTADVNAAQKLNLGLSQTLTGVDIALLATRTASISGIVVDVEGRPVRGSIQVMPRGGLVAAGTISGGPLRPDGTFTIANLAPGEYVLRAMIPPGSSGPSGAFVPPGPGARPDMAVATVTVNGEDVSGVRLTHVTPVEVNGRIMFDSAASAQLVKPSAITVVPQFVDDFTMAGLGLIGGPPPTVRDDLTFQLRTAPGRIALRPVAQGLLVRSVRVNGRDVTDTGITVGAEGVSDVEIELTNVRQEISGSVTQTDGKATTDYIVLFFAQDRARWSAPFNRYFAVGRPIGDGGFKVTLPPGEYYAAALNPVDQGEWQDPEFLTRLVREATTFSLNEGEKRTLDLKVATPQ